MPSARTIPLGLFSLLVVGCILPLATAEAPSLVVDRYFHSYLTRPKFTGPQEATLYDARAGQLGCVYWDRSERLIKRKLSSDAGHTWSEAESMLDLQGKPLLNAATHITILHLKSGRYGMVHAASNVPAARLGRDGGSVFRTSDDGLRWSDPLVVERRFGIVCSGHGIVLSSGRIVLPMFKWLSPDPTGASEQPNAPASLSYSYAYVSDDEGQTWTESLSELFVNSQRAAYDLEEPTAVELKDGRLLMHLRSQLGRIYRSYSRDGGISWTRPEGLSIAASYTPSIVRRIPKTGDLVMIWNQIQRMEVVNGLHRHRLSIAISRDEGHTWTNFKNLESLDDQTVIVPPPADRIEVIEQWEDYGYYQPSAGRKRYTRAPGVLRICYPDIAFVGDQAVVVYDYGEGVLGPGVVGTKLRTFPIAWLYN